MKLLLMFTIVVLSVVCDAKKNFFDDSPKSSGPVSVHNVSSVGYNGSSVQKGMTSVGKSIGSHGKGGIQRNAGTLSLYNGTCYFRIVKVADVNEFHIDLAFNHPIETLSIENFSVVSSKHYKIFKLTNTVPITTDDLEIQFMAGYYPRKRPFRGRCHTHKPKRFHKPKRTVKHRGAP